MYESYQGLIFDMDGTLLDTEPTHHQAWRCVLSKYGLSYDQAAVSALSGSPTWRVAQFIIHQNQVTMDAQHLALEKTQMVEKLLLSGEVLELPVMTIVRQYAGRKPMAVGTGSERKMAEMLLKGLGVREYFTAIVGADDVVRHKPEPDTFLLCAELIGVAPQHCLVFEDAEFGFQAARNANMSVVDVRQMRHLYS